MASIQDAVNKNVQRYAAGGEPGTAPQPPATPFIAAPPQDLPIQAPQRGQIPISSVNPADINDSNRMYRGQGSRSATYPYPNRPAIASAASSAQAVAAAVSPATAALSIQVNGAPTPVQDILDLIAGTGVTLTPDATGGITIDSTATGDGLTHSAAPWESDAAYIMLRDDFFQTTGLNFASSTAVSGIGELGWFLGGNVGGDGGITGGVPPYLGQFGWGNSTVANGAGCLMLGASGANSASGDTHAVGTWALGENPGWRMTWVFKLEGDIYNTAAAFGATQKSLYIGLCGTTVGAQVIAANTSPRPDVFIGLRFDTSTASPAISDSFYTLEVVANHSFSSAARHNTQGTTFVTNVAPAPGVWHRVDITCSVAGSVTVILDGSSTNTLTATIPTMTFTGALNTISGKVINNQAIIAWTVGASSDPPESPWGSGSLVTVSGLIGAAILNGSHTLTTSENNGINFDIVTANVNSATGTATLSGYPSFMPVCIMGNDNQSLPTANTMTIAVDFFSFIWNPNLGPSAPGTPDATLPRYW